MGGMPKRSLHTSALEDSPPAPGEGGRGRGLRPARRPPALKRRHQAVRESLPQGLAQSLRCRLRSAIDSATSSWFPPRLPIRPTPRGGRRWPPSAACSPTRWHGSPSVSELVPGGTFRDLDSETGLGQGGTGLFRPPAGRVKNGALRDGCFRANSLVRKRRSPILPKHVDPATVGAADVVPEPRVERDVRDPVQPAAEGHREEGGLAGRRGRRSPRSRGPSGRSPRASSLLH